MKGKILALIFFINFTSFLSLNAQWARTYGGSEDDFASSILQTSDGGYIVYGSTESFGVEYLDIWILKLNIWGEIEWQKTYGEDISDYTNNAYSIQKTNDGGYIIGGSISVSGFGHQFWIIKLSSNRDIIWQKSYGDDLINYAYSLQQTSDGGYIVAGNTGINDAEGHDILILKLFFDGTIEWTKTYGESKDDKPSSILHTSDGGYVVAGYTMAFGAGSSDIWILKLASDGAIEWQKTYGGSEGEIARSIQQTNDGGYIVAGAGSGDFLVLKLASDGTIEWQKAYGSESGSAHSIQQTSDGGYIVAGETSSFGAGNGDIWVLKLSLVGDIEWQKTYGGIQSDEASSIQQTSDGGYIVAGSTDSYGAGERDFLILKLSSNGDIDPACGFIRESNAEVSDAGISSSNTDIIPQDTTITPKDTTITPKDSDALVYDLCSGGQHTLSLSAGSGGITAPQPGTYIYDHAVRISISADPDEGYNFSEWSGDVSSTDRWLSITMDSDKSINANFSMIVIDDVWEDVNKSPCFIATAAYGSPLHPYVQILREFKDKYLISNKLGRSLVSFYYKYSPFVTNLIAKHKVLKVIAQMNLFPFVVFSYSILYFGSTITAAVFIVIFVPPVCLVWRYRRKFRRQNRKIKNTSSYRFLF